ncbi:hypothetical protein MHTCC0001_16700 [Flavobacteriaceae bacterium MHTCC 0001]
MPVSVVHKTSADNKGSASKYGFYLNKENQEYIKEGTPEKQQFFFNQNEDRISTVRAINLIDQNTKGKGLKKVQDKYFTLTINFSEKELRHIAKKVSGKDIKNVNDLNQEEYIKYNKAIAQYVKIAMKNYSANFNKNVSEKDIVWTAKIEHKRRFKGFEKEVENGMAKSGELKKGMQSHVHITVSRMHKDYRVSLSPLANARKNDNLVLNGKSRPGGFDRSNWKQLNEASFDKAFQYNRPLEEQFETLRILKNGSLEQKQTIQSKIIEEKIKQNDNEITL